MATTDIISYYQKLLILQYLQKVRAYAMVGATVTPALLPDTTVQSLSFVNAPASGTFELSYGGLNTSAIAWNASAVTIQGDLNAILTAPLTVSVSGSIASSLTFSFSNVSSAVQNISVVSNSLLDSLGSPVVASVSAIGPQLPLTVQSGFNITGSSTAIGAQLDIIGKYVGVSRTGFGFFGPITLGDTDFLTLIQIAIIRNRSGSSLATIQSLLNEFFAGEIYLFDYASMKMSYLINTSIGSENLLQLFVKESLLPKPMGVGISVIANSVIDKFFSFRTYQAAAAPNTTPFNSYASYQTSWLSMSYAYSVTPAISS